MNTENTAINDNKLPQNPKVRAIVHKLTATLVGGWFVNDFSFTYVLYLIEHALAVFRKNMKFFLSLSAR